MSGRGIPVTRASPVPREMSPSFPREGKWGLNLVNGSALAVLVVRGAAERLFATLCVRGLVCFLIEGKLADVCSAHVTSCKRKLSVLRAPPPRWPHGWFQL